MYEHEGSRLRKLAGNTAVRITYDRHARHERMKEYNISITEIPPLLTRCKAIDVQPGGYGKERWLAEGKLTSDGRLIHVVVEPDEGSIRIYVVTVIDKTINKHR